MSEELVPGVYDRVVDGEVAAALANLADHLRYEAAQVDQADLAQRLGELVGSWVSASISGYSSATRHTKAAELVAQLGMALDHDALGLVDKKVHALRSIHQLDPAGRPVLVRRPVSPLRDTFLLTNAPSEPAIGHEIESEIESADRIDVIMAFIRWTGIRDLLAPLRRHVEAGKPLRVLTTTYTGSTEPRALNELAALGADIKVSYDTSTTRLHAKAWLFHRSTGFSTTYVGSSNLTHSAQIAGVEWNVRATAVSTPAVLDKFSSAFETYWADAGYERYDPERFATAIAQTRNVGSEQLFLMDMRPFPFQLAMLEQLAVERQRGHHQNLVVSATGTGKTAIAAFDYRRLRTRLDRSRLLFVAHRKEILHQSQALFRHVLSDGSFGELWVDGQQPDKWEHVFASIQSINAGLLERLPPDHFDIVIVDEFHHAAADSYQRALAYLHPQHLLGLTATPERSDQMDILSYFGGRIAVELRLWDALQQGFLTPFHYFGIHDGTDLSEVPFRRGFGYDIAALEHVYTADHAWASKVVAATRETVTDIHRMRALGFCASVKHAQFTAQYFNNHQVAATAIHGGTPANERQQALNDLRDGKLQAIFAVDVFNEGLDIPQVDTVLMLRPTQSATIFLQQLGRGLRKVEGKDVLTVLDFVGHQHHGFLFEQTFRKMLGRSRTELIDDLENDFPFLPAGTRIHLDPIARKIVLDNVKNSLPTTWSKRVAELRNLGDVTLSKYLAATGLDLPDVYANNHSWSELRQRAGFERDEPDLMVSLGKGVRRLLHVDDPQRIETWRRYLNASTPPIASELGTTDRRLLEMLVLTLFNPKGPGEQPLDEALAVLWRVPAIRSEIQQVLPLLDELRLHLAVPSGLGPDIALQTHARYGRNEILAAIGAATTETPASHREGVYYSGDLDLDVMLVTLQKTEKDFSPLTRYRDYAISDELFHWESQHNTSVNSPTGQRYIHQRERGSNAMLFVRHANQLSDGRTEPFFNYGLVDYVSHQSDRPIQITWRLRNPLPGDLFAAYRAAVA